MPAATNIEDAAMWPVIPISGKSCSGRPIDLERYIGWIADVSSGGAMFADRQLACGWGRLRGARILIAEDAWLIAEALSLLLEEEGAKVVGPSATAAEAIELLGENDVDIALIDMSLQDTFADTLADELLARKVPYMILTGFGALPTNADEGALMVLRKPIDKVALIDILSGFVAART